MKYDFASTEDKQSNSEEKREKEKRDKIHAYLLSKFDFRVFGDFS